MTRLKHSYTAFRKNENRLDKMAMTLIEGLQRIGLHPDDADSYLEEFAIRMLYAEQEDEAVGWYGVRLESPDNNEQPFAVFDTASDANAFKRMYNDSQLARADGTRAAAAEVVSMKSFPRDYEYEVPGDIRAE